MKYALFIASALGAVALFLMMPRGRSLLPRLGAILGAVTLAGLWVFLAPTLEEHWRGSWPMVYYYLFSAIGLAAAVRVITHTRPVYSALWFVMTVLATAGMFLLLSAEFMAFALVIIYGGAILVTYVFVIMLAAEASGGAASLAEREQAANESDLSPFYDRIAREPAAAVVVGFLILAMLLNIAFRDPSLPARLPNPAAAGPSDKSLVRNTLPARAADRLANQLPEADRTALADTDLSANQLTNVERVGLDLFRGHPLGLELAGVILLISLVGAVVIARQRVEEREPGRA